jgi:hypothetical protein
MCSGNLIGYLGFFRRGVFIGEGAMSEVEPGALTWARRGQGPGRATPLCGALVAPLRHFFGSLEAFGKNKTSGLVSSNSENIFCVSLLKHKNSRKQETGTVVLVNRLVPENA